ncbi:MAG: ABC transporter substrate-binding protein [Candidatus Lumbricidophila eiseniae]|uniref:ABC transporter substrate-binding protein n=1 Tax=Candidatus Lumbricidiphila eiseniae TaxID=1969409 RepID=A0A2A6FT85_9MICO|nr:MAG: ABC transporter substrate-binding protein [Candidatus Lumbricidophila eiseniae]
MLLTCHSWPRHPSPEVLVKSSSRHLRSVISTVGLTTTIALTLTACGPSSTSSTTPNAGTSTGSLVVGITTDPDTLFPWKATQFQAVNIAQNLYGTLTEFDRDLNVVPGLAQSWDTSADGKTITFHLRTGATFASGAPFDSAAVKYSLDTINDQATAAVARSSLASVTAITATDAHTVTLTLSAPDAALPANLASINMAILPPGATEQSISTKPDGTGAFTLSDRKPSQSITLAANPTHWSGAPKLTRVEYRIIPDESSIVSAMQSGNVQFAVLNDPLVAKTARSDKISVSKTPQLSYHALQLNASRGVLSDVNVRLAIQCAIDRQQVIDTAALSEGTVTGPITSPAYLSDPKARPCPTRDLTKAADYLAKAGKSAGVTVNTIVSQGEYATSVNEAQNLKAQLADAKITLNLEVLDSDAYVKSWVAADFDAAVALNGGRPDPDGMYGRYFTSTGNLNKVAGYSSPALDALFAQGKSTTDPAVRKDIYTKVSAELENNAAWIWMFTSYSYTATTSGVRGFIPMANGSLQYLWLTTN